MKFFVKLLFLNLILFQSFKSFSYTLVNTTNYTAKYEIGSFIKGLTGTLKPGQSIEINMNEYDAAYLYTPMRLQIEVKWMSPEGTELTQSLSKYYEKNFFEQFRHDILANPETKFNIKLKGNIKHFGKFRQLPIDVKHKIMEYIDLKEKDQERIFAISLSVTLPEKEKDFQASIRNAEIVLKEKRKKLANEYTDLLAEILEELASNIPYQSKKFDFSEEEALTSGCIVS